MRIREGRAPSEGNHRGIFHSHASHGHLECCVRSSVFKKANTRKDGQESFSFRNISACGCHLGWTCRIFPSIDRGKVERTAAKPRSSPTTCRKKRIEMQTRPKQKRRFVMPTITYAFPPGGISVRVLLRGGKRPGGRSRSLCFVLRGFSHRPPVARKCATPNK